MAYTRPSLQTIVARVIGDISSRTAGSAYIRSSAERALAYVLAGVAHSVHGHLEWVRKQLLPTTCEIAGLRAWGVLLDLPENPATQAVREVTFAASSGAIGVGVALQDAEGRSWTVTVGGAYSAGVVIVTATADDAGSAGNLDDGAPLSLVVPIAGIDTDGAVSDTVSDGSDAEDVEAYRVRILDELRTPASGGGAGDYVKWAKQVSGVTRAWEFGKRMGVGTVSLAFVRDDDSGSIIPDAGEVAAVQAYIDLKKPLDMRAAYVQAPIAKPVNITISNLVPNTLAVKNAIVTELQTFFREESDLEVAMAQSRIDEAISQAEGETSHEITSISSLVPGAWELLTLGTVTFA